MQEKSQVYLSRLAKFNGYYLGLLNSKLRLGAIRINQRKLATRMDFLLMSQS